MSKLFIMNGPDKGKSYPFESNIIYLGRLPDNDIQIKEKSISRKHLRIQQKGNKFLLRDLNSKNGTFINGRIVRPGMDFEVEEGVPIAVGKIFISLGVECKEDIFSIQELEDLSDEFSSTAMFTAYRDRPHTSPKNMDFFYKVSTALTQSLNIDEIMEKVLDYIFELFKRIDRGVIILLDYKTGDISSVISRTETNKNNKSTVNPRYSKTIVNKVIQNGKPIIMLDTLGLDDSDVSDSMELMNVKSVMCVPLISKSQVRGVIYVDSVKIPFGFREEDLSLINALSSPAAIAIENALLYSDMERLVQERTENLISTEKMLRESEKRFKSMFNNMSSGVIIFKVGNEGNDFTILDINRAGCKIEKITKKQAIRKNALDIFPELKTTALMENLLKVWENKKPEQCLITLSGDENTIWKEYFLFHLPNDEIVAIVNDVSEKRKAEMDQKALQEQLFAAQKMESIGAFAGGTAHNFRNILQAISGNIEYLEALYGDKPEITDLVKNIYGSIDKGVDLINNLLHFSRKGWKLEMEDLDLADVITRTHEIIANVLNRNIEIKLDLENNLAVHGNFSLLSQAFLNLFTNARDAMPGGGELIIQARKFKNTVTAVVSDTGHGIDQDVIDKIFDPFFTLKDVGAGTGLGLSTTLGIIEQHKGSINVSSKPGEGASFKISLPATNGKIVQKVEPKGEIKRGKEQKVMIVDDEESVLDSLSSLIEKLGYKAIPVNRSTEAVLNYQKLEPDLVLIDRNMPGLDGPTCIKRLVEIDPSVKVVIISGYDISGPDGIDDDIKKMIKGYLTKPCGMTELSTAISQALGD